MTSLRSLSNSLLLETTARLATEERRITVSVLRHFREVERRKAYSELGYKSLFEYATRHLRYSEGSASRRIAAMHALKDLPELESEIQSGKTNVSNVSRIHTTIRREERLSGQKASLVKKRDLFAQMAALPHAKLEQELISFSPRAAIQEKTVPVGPDLHEIRIYLSTPELEMLEKLKNLLAHALPNASSNSDIMRKLIQLAGEKHFKEPKKTQTTDGASSPSECTASPAAGNEGDSCDDAKEIPQEKSREKPRIPPRNPLSASLRKRLLFRAGFRCEYEDPKTKRRCEGRSFLQIEHRQPRSMGGSNTPSNLEVLCRDHNQIRGIRAFGCAKMRRR